MAEGVHGGWGMWGHAWQGGGRAWWGACVAGRVHAGETVIDAGSTHPTGMHSCSNLFLLKCGKLKILNTQKECSTDLSAMLK